MRGDQWRVMYVNWKEEDSDLVVAASHIRAANFSSLDAHLAQDPVLCARGSPVLFPVIVVAGIPNLVGSGDCPVQMTQIHRPAVERSYTKSPGPQRSLRNKGLP
jgi:hypothetical protein